MESITASAARFGGIGLLRLQSDERLAELAAAGHQPAFDVLDRRYRASLERACRRILPADRAEDAVQQALLNAHQALARGGSPEKVRPWLHRIAVNASLREIGDRWQEALDIDEERVAGGASPPEVLEQRQQVRSAVGAIGELPERQRTALVRREFEGRGHQEIARELGVSGGAVRQLIHRARNAVRGATSAVVPPQLIVALLTRAETTGVVTDATAAGIGGGLGTKALVTALVAGGIAGGAGPDLLDGPGGTGALERGSAVAAADTPSDGRGSSPGDPADHDGPGSGTGSDASGHGEGTGHDGGDRGAGDSSGPGADGREESADHDPGGGGHGSPGKGDDDFEPPDGDDFDDDPTSGGSGSSGPGPGESSGSGSSGSGSSGSGGRGSDSSGSGGGDDDD